MLTNPNLDYPGTGLANGQLAGLFLVVAKETSTDKVNFYFSGSLFLLWLCKYASGLPHLTVRQSKPQSPNLSHIVHLLDVFS